MVEKSGSPFSLPRCPRYLSLDMWRGIACLFVILYHSVLVYSEGGRQADSAVVSTIIGFFHELNIGVVLFFVISGYCIAAASDSARRHGSAVRRYFLRRFRRIYPPLWIVTAMAIVFFVAVDVIISPGLLSSSPWPQLRPWWYSPSQWFGNVTLTETWRHYFWGVNRGHFPGQAWTLCYEEQFYAVTGALLLVPRFLFRGAVAVTALTVVAMAASRVWQFPIEGFFFDGNWLIFAAGVLVYYHINYCSQGQRRLSYAILGTALLLAVWLNLPAGVPAFGFAIMLAVLHRHDVAIASSALTRPLLWCGQMCYSLYLVHQLIVKAVSQSLYAAGIDSGLATLMITVPASVLASVAAGQIFYRLVERRFLNTPAPTRLAVTERPFPASAVAPV
jgi:peptidoglycan/LPS O-acetylase OafA/YrhL